MDTRVERLIEAFKDKNLWGARGLNADIARKTGFTRSYVGQVFKGTKDPADKFIMAVCSSFGINSEWAFEGKEPVLERMDNFYFADDKENRERIIQTIKKSASDLFGSLGKQNDSAKLPDPAKMLHIGEVDREMFLEVARQISGEESMKPENQIAREMFASLVDADNDRQAIISLVKTLKGPQLKAVLKFVTDLVSRELK